MTPSIPVCTPGLRKLWCLSLVCLSSECLSLCLYVVTLQFLGKMVLIHNGMFFQIWCFMAKQVSCLAAYGGWGEIRSKGKCEFCSSNYFSRFYHASTGTIIEPGILIQRNCVDVL